MKTQIPDDLVQDIINRLGLKTDAAKPYVRLALEHAILFDGKQRDYGPRNISSFGLYGVIVRLNDKWERIKNLFASGRRKRAVNESVRDTFRDIHVYANIALMVESGQWPDHDGGTK